VKTYLVILAVFLAVSGCLHGSAGEETTTPPPKPVPVLDLTDVNITANSTSATITWTTDREADSLVRYGTRSGKYNMSEGSREYVTFHNITLKGLLPGETYYLRVGSVDPNGTAAQSNEYSFQTIPLPPPVITDISVSPTATTARIGWTTVIASEAYENLTEEGTNATNQTLAEISYTPVNTSCVVMYGTSGSYNTSNWTGRYAESHSITLRELLPGSRYRFLIRCVDTNGVSNQSGEQEFTTEPADLWETIVIGDLEVRLTDFGYHSEKRTVEGGEKLVYYSKVTISIENTGDERIPLSITSTAIVDNTGYQFERVSLGEEDEFQPTELFPGGKISRALYYEKMWGSSGTLYIDINSKPLQFHVP